MAPEERHFCFPSVSEDRARFLYASGTGEYNKVVCPLTSRIKRKLRKNIGAAKWVLGSRSERVWKSQLLHICPFKIFLATILTSRYHHNVL